MHRGTGLPVPRGRDTFSTLVQRHTEIAPVPTLSFVWLYSGRHPLVKNEKAQTQQKEVMVGETHRQSIKWRAEVRFGTKIVSNLRNLLKWKCEKDLLISKQIFDRPILCSN